MSLAPADASIASPPPKDPWNLAYSIYLLLGAGYLVPWNAFISAIDYFVLLYPDGQIGRVFSILYMIPCLIAVLLLTFFGRGIPSHLRVNAGLALFIAMLLLVPLMNLLFISDATGTWATYAVTVLAAPINGVADALVQGSIVGSSGELPSRYMQALMIGTAISGVLTSVLRVITKAVMPQDDSGTVASAYLYFSVSALIMVACIVGYNIVEKLPVMQHYKRLKTTTIESNHLLDDSHADNENEAVVQKSGNAGNLDRKEIVYYLPIWKKIQGPALAVAFIYVVTLSIFPGHITEDLQSTFFGDWYAVLLVLDYNLADLIGKCLASVNPFMTENKIIAIGGSLGRVVFYLLFYLCLHGPSFFQGDVVVIVITGLLGLTNGYFTTILMVLAPKSVPLEEAEVAAFLMVIFLILGLGAGSALEWIWVL